MNEKLKSNFRCAWNEPRHFFLWLTLFSLCGYVMIASLGAGSVVLAFLALGCVLCFTLSLPAFVLAWIPPIGRLLSSLLRRRFLVLAFLVTLVALCYAVEDWRGRRAWQEFRRVEEAKGERFELANFIPPPVPDDRNFFETPLWNPLKFTVTNGNIVWSEANHEQLIILSYATRGMNTPPGAGDWMDAQYVDLRAWQAYYRGSNNLFAAHAGPATNYFPITKEPQTPAADVSLALGKFEANRQLLMAASARPQARFWINYGAGFGMLLPHLARLKAASQFLSLHACAALKLGDRATALEDAKLVSVDRCNPGRADPDLASGPGGHAANCPATSLGRPG